jgi:ectoine hydroxylase-related dioxygenase (phytanoyl-CoA dioxygenase family)
MSASQQESSAFQMTQDKAAFFQENGYLVLPEALRADEVDELREDTLAICRQEYGPILGTQPVRPGESEEELLTRHLCIHFPHKCSPVMAKYMAHPAVVEALTRVIGPNVKCMQSMLFIKAAGKPGQAWHQDEYYIPTRDRSLTGGWIALDRAHTGNGCLWVIPGSHKRGVIYPQKQHDDHRFDCSGLAHGFPYSDEDAVPVEVAAGSIVLFNGYLLHRSLPNTEERGFRRALVNHYMSAESLLPWVNTEEGMHVGAADKRDIVMVAGEDPYAWKGTEDLHRPLLRPSGEGGCGKRAEKEAGTKVESSGKPAGA